MEYTSHRCSNRVVMRVERSWVLCAASWAEFLRRSEKRLNRLISEHNEGGYRPEACRPGLITTGLANALHDLLATELLQVVRRVGGTILCRVCLLSAQTRAASSEAVKPSEEADKAMTASATQRMRGLLRSIPPTMTLPTRDAVGSRSSV
jgi:hypothetical protein